MVDRVYRTRLQEGLRRRWQHITAVVRGDETPAPFCVFGVRLLLIRRLEGDTDGIILGLWREIAWNGRFAYQEIKLRYKDFVDVKSRRGCPADG